MHKSLWLCCLLLIISINMLCALSSGPAVREASRSIVQTIDTGEPIFIEIRAGQFSSVLANEVKKQLLEKGADLREAELDLVEVSGTAVPPVCRVMDFGKFLYERTKKEREARKAQTKIEVKEIRLRPKTNEHHRGFKTRDARRWLMDGNKVRVTVRFRGREISYPDLALEDLKEIAEELSDIAAVEQAPALEGKTMSMVLAPSRAPKKKAEGEAKPEAPKPAEG